MQDPLAQAEEHLAERTRRLNEKPPSPEHESLSGASSWAFDGPRRRVLVVGAGLAGLACARLLADAGVPVQLLEKSVAPGGRLVHRLRDGHLLDDGAPAFHGANPGFTRLMRLLAEDRLVLPWDPPAPLQSPCWIAPRGARTLTDRLARGLEIAANVRVQSLSLEGPGVRLLSADGRTFEGSAVVLTAPVPQSMELLSSLPEEPAHAPLRGLRYERALVASFLLDAPAGKELAPTGGLSLLVEESRKGRDGRVVTVHASPAEAEQRAEEPEEASASWLREELRGALGLPEGATLPLLHLKRWRYARPVAPLGLGAVGLCEGRVLLAGDGLADGTAGGAWASGCAAASMLLASWAPRGSL
jgi:renalase